MACRLPGRIDSPAKLHRALFENGSMPHSLWELFGDDGRYGYEFDGQFFGLTPRKCRLMAPEHGLLLEVCWEALESANVALDQVDGTSIGVYVGADMEARPGVYREGIAGFLGQLPSSVSGRISYDLRLTGPSMTVNTACTSGLVATHMAVQALRTGECNLALVAGVNVLTRGDHARTLLQQAELAPRDGVCRPFDAAAEGFVVTEGCSVLLLERLSDVLARGGRARASIRGTAHNGDGVRNGFWGPNPRGQREAICRALQDAGLDAESVRYVEGHGSGGLTGDECYCSSLSTAFPEKS